MSDKKYPLTVAPLFKSGNFSLNSITITPEIIEKLGEIEVGGKFTIRTLKEESRKNERSPNAYLEYLTPLEVEERKSFYQNSGV